MNDDSGNAAAMREACQKMLDLLMLRGDGNVRCVLTWDEFNESQKMLRIALSAPARNCDLYDTQPTMSMAYEAYRKAAMRSYGNGLTGAVPMVKQKPMTYDEWLLAPAAERKGDGDGSK